MVETKSTFMGEIRTTVRWPRVDAHHKFGVGNLVILNCSSVFTNASIVTRKT